MTKLQNKNDADIASEIVWGAEAIGAVIGLKPRQAHHLIEKKALPVKKVGGRWCANRAKLLDFFNQTMNPGGL